MVTLLSVSRQRVKPADRPRRETEWRTPPLWGVAASAPYLHDGRAPTLLDAILLHDGQAKPAAARFGDLTAADQARVLELSRIARRPRDCRRERRDRPPGAGHQTGRRPPASPAGCGGSEAGGPDGCAASLDFSLK